MRYCGESELVLSVEDAAAEEPKFVVTLSLSSSSTVQCSMPINACNSWCSGLMESTGGSVFSSSLLRISCSRLLSSASCSRSRSCLLLWLLLLRWSCCCWFSTIDDDDDDDVTMLFTISSSASSVFCTVLCCSLFIMNSDVPPPPLTEVQAVPGR